MRRMTYDDIIQMAGYKSKGQFEQAEQLFDDKLKRAFEAAGRDHDPEADMPSGWLWSLRKDKRRTLAQYGDITVYQIERLPRVLRPRHYSFIDHLATDAEVLQIL